MLNEPATHPAGAEGDPQLYMLARLVGTPQEEFGIASYWDLALRSQRKTASAGPGSRSHQALTP